MDDVAVASGRGEEAGTPATRLTLAPELTSVPAARRWLTARLGSVPEELRRTVALLTSELVTNAVLHAATALTVSVRVDGGRVRVEVADGSPQVPSLKEYGLDAATGRGLTVLTTLADEWGTSVDDRGKVVWFEVGAPSTGPSGPAITGMGRTAVELDDSAELLDMALLAVPVDALVRAQAAYEELFREFRLVVERDPAGTSRAIQGRLLALVEELGTRFSGFTSGADQEWRDAVARGEKTVDLHYRLPRDVGAACRQYDALLDEADEFCRAAALLTLAAPPEVVALRKWVLEEFVRQAEGAAAVAWARSEWAAH